MGAFLKIIDAIHLVAKLGKVLRTQIAKRRLTNEIDKKDSALTRDELERTLD